MKLIVDNADYWMIPKSTLHTIHFHIKKTFQTTTITYKSTYSHQDPTINPQPFKLSSRFDPRQLHWFEYDYEQPVLIASTTHRPVDYDSSATRDRIRRIIKHNTFRCTNEARELALPG